MEVRNIQEYIDTIEKLMQKNTYEGNSIFRDKTKPHFLYRGHGNHEKYKLEPLMMRVRETKTGSVTEFSQLEYNILTDFISEACSYQRNTSVNDIVGWLEIAQHYGIPTRLMDLTENPLIALYFACRSKSEYKASVWIINETEYLKRYWEIQGFRLAIDSQKIVTDIINGEIISLGQAEQQNFSRYEYPWIYKPCYREERMKLQSSYFMLWGRNHGALTDIIKAEDYMILDEEKVNGRDGVGVLCAIEIPAECKDNILQQLDMIGINEKFIYPGLEGIGKTLSNKYHS